MTTQLPNGYEAVKNIPDPVTRIHLSETSHGLAVNDGARILQVIGAGHTLLGRADELTEEQCGEVVEQEFLPEAKELMWVYKDYLDTTELNAAYFLTALESFRSLLASLHLEPHTTIILKKENV